MLDIKSLATVNEKDGFLEVKWEEVGPATAEWLADNADTLRGLLRQSDPALVELTLNGDATARFVLRARQTVARALAVMDANPDWQGLHTVSLADILNDYASVSQGRPTRERRHDVLEMLRTVFTEVLHQQVGGNGTRLPFRILKNEAYRL
jgi:hypothetical protein